MAVVPLKIRYDGKDAERGLAGMTGELKKLAGATLAFVAASKAIGFAKDQYLSFVDDARGAKLLDTEIKKLGGSMSLYNQQLDEIHKQTFKLAIDDTKMADALREVATKTGDADNAMKSWKLILDIANKEQIDYAAAADIVTSAMVGNMRALGALGGEFKVFAKENVDLQHTFEGSQKAIDLLMEKYEGASEERMETVSGQMDRIKTTWNEILEQLTRLATGDMDKQLEFWKSIGDLMERFALALDRINASKLGEVIRAIVALHSLWSNTFGLNRMLNTFLPPMSDVEDRRRDNQPPPKPDPARVPRPAMPQRPVFDFGEFEMHDLTDNSWESGHAINQQRIAEQKELLDQWHESMAKELEANKKMLDDLAAAYQEKLETVAGYLEGAFNVLFANMRDGFKATVDAMANYLFQQITAAIAKIMARMVATKLLGFMFGGPLGAAGASAATSAGSSAPGGVGGGWGMYGSAPGVFSGVSAARTGSLIARSARW